MTRPIPQWLVGVLACSIVLVGCASARQNPIAGEGAEGELFDWNEPIMDGVELPTNTDALTDVLGDLDRSPLPFTAISPEPLGPPLRAQASSPATPIEDVEVDLVYDFGGRAVVSQHLTEYQATVAVYEQDAAMKPGCETVADDPQLDEDFGEGAEKVTCTLGDRSLTRLDDGTLIFASDGDGSSVSAMVEAAELTPAAERAFKDPVIEITIQSPDLGSDVLLEQLAKMLSSNGDGAG